MILDFVVVDLLFYREKVMVGFGKGGFCFSYIFIFC